MTRMYENPSPHVHSASLVPPVPLLFFSVDPILAKWVCLRRLVAVRLLVFDAADSVM